MEVVERLQVFNPAFVARVHAKRREAARQADLARREREEAERAERWRKIVAERQRKAAEAEAIVTVSVDAPTSIRALIRATELRHGLPAGSIVGHDRSRSVTSARFEAMAKAREMRPELSLPQLGRIFHRDHTTILYALRKMGCASRSTTTGEAR